MAAMLRAVAPGGGSSCGGASVPRLNSSATGLRRRSSWPSSASRAHKSLSACPASLDISRGRTVPRYQGYWRTRLRSGRCGATFGAREADVRPAVRVRQAALAGQPPPPPLRHTRRLGIQGAAAKTVWHTACLRAAETRFKRWHGAAMPVQLEAPCLRVRNWNPDSGLAEKYFDCTRSSASDDQSGESSTAEYKVGEKWWRIGRVNAVSCAAACANACAAACACSYVRVGVYELVRQSRTCMHTHRDATSQRDTFPRPCLPVDRRWRECV
eukprot:49458-Pleurochrysis_carterae.AAC.2